MFHITAKKFKNIKVYGINRKEDFTLTICSIYIGEKNGFK